MRVAVTGAGGRLGRALLAALADAGTSGRARVAGVAERADAAGVAGRAGVAGPIVSLGWDVPEHDLDDPESPGRLVRRDHPDVVIHTAAWTDVDGCARDPELALRRNGAAVGDLAAACAAAGIGLVHVSTNEVFDGRRTDGRGYLPGDEPRPINPYGASKRAGEVAAQRAFGERRGVVAEERPEGGAPPDGPQLAIVRTAWLFGPPGNDFPAKILAAAGRARAAGEPLRVVGDELGSPTYTQDLAGAIVALVLSGVHAGIHHVVNGGTVSRAGWARAVLGLAGVDAALVEVPLATWPRPSAVPPRAVLEATPLPGGPLRPWQAALADYLPILLESRAAEVHR